MTHHTADVVICGAGIAGVAVAYALSHRHDITDVVLVDERPPLTLTSDKSTECYRNWWPGPDDAMVQLMNRSIDLLEALAHASNNRFLLNRRGYVYAAADPAAVANLVQQAETAARLGAGPLRRHLGAPTDPPYRPADPHAFVDQPDGADLFLDPELIRRYFPGLAPDIRAVLHTRRCGWLSGQQLGLTMLEAAQARGVTLMSGRVTAVHVRGGSVAAVQVDAAGHGQRIATRRFVNAAGPLVGPVAALLDVDLPVFHELHLKLNFNDHLGIVPRQAPMLIWAEGQRLPWADDEAAMLAVDPETRWLVEPLPDGAHLRPDGPADSTAVLMLWPYHTRPVPAVLPPPLDPEAPELILRGLCRLMPGLEVYLARMPRPYIDGGYYTKTQENRLLACPLPVAGAGVLGALSGYGIMAAPAAGELLAAHIAGAALPPYAPAFHLDRYDDPGYRQRLAAWGPSAQL